MAYNKYYQDELNYLRELGALFAEQNPSLAGLLAEEGDDPDVERLFEGFAFLSGRIRQKIDDELPEISHSLIELLWPNYLRPVPSMSILEFTPKPGVITAKQTIKSGAKVQSQEVDGTPCIFRTCYDVDVAPISITDLHTIEKTDSSAITLNFDIQSGVDATTMGLDKIRLFLHDDQKIPVSKPLLLSIFRYLLHFDVRVHYADGSQHTFSSCSKDQVRHVGFSGHESLLPNEENVFSGYRLIQEYFQLPEKFLFFDIVNFSQYLDRKDIERFSITFNFSRLFTNNANLKKENFRLFSTPIVNLFDYDGEPIRKDNHRIEYVLRPHTRNPRHYEIFSVDEVSGKYKGLPTSYPYEQYESFKHHDELSENLKPYYKLRTLPAVVGDGVDHYIYFKTTKITEKSQLQETVSSKLTCSNSRLASTLQSGQIAYDSGDSPDFVSYKNLIRATPSLSPPLEGSLHWRLISNLALQYQSLSSIEALQLLIKYYDFAAFGNRQKQRSNQQMYEGFEDIKTEHCERLFKGKAVSGLRTTLRLKESKFGAKGIIGEANMYLFASVLNQYFSQYARTNSFHKLEVHAVESGEVYTWNTETGNRARF